jgi:hypothetical protein
MPTSEGLFSQEGNKRPEQNEPAYLKAARFPDESSSLIAYSSSQDAIAKIPCSLSTFRLLLEQVWHVAVLGDVPPDELRSVIEENLASGELVDLPSEIVESLSSRRRAATKIAPWVEGHHRPRRRTQN